MKAVPYHTNEKYTNGILITPETEFEEHFIEQIFKQQTRNGNIWIKHCLSNCDIVGLVVENTIDNIDEDIDKDE